MSHSTEMSAIRTITVPFHGANLFVLDHGGQPFTPMKPIIEGMGLTWHGQHAKIKANTSRWGVLELRIPSGGGLQAMLCTPLRKLPGWLTTIEPGKVKNPDVRARVIDYQNECDDALWQYWNEGAAFNPRAFSVNTRISAAQAQHLKELVQLIVESGKQSYAETWSRLHRKMKANSYLELSADQFDVAREYLLGKMDGQSIAAIAKKHFPHIEALPALADQALTTEQANTLRDMLIDASKAMPKDLQGALMHEGCQNLRDHFKVDYCEIPQSRFNEAVALVSRHNAHWHQSRTPAAPTLAGRRWLVSYDSQGREVVEPLPVDALVITPDVLPGLIMQNHSLFTSAEVLKIASSANQRLMGEANRIKRHSAFEQLKNTVCTLGASDLNEIATQAWLELTLRTATSNGLVTN